MRACWHWVKAQPVAQACQLMHGLSILALFVAVNLNSASTWQKRSRVINLSATRRIRLPTWLGGGKGNALGHGSKIGC